MCFKCFRNNLWAFHSVGDENCGSTASSTSQWDWLWKRDCGFWTAHMAWQSRHHYCTQNHSFIVLYSRIKACHWSSNLWFEMISFQQVFRIIFADEANNQNIFRYAVRYRLETFERVVYLRVFDGVTWTDRPPLTDFPFEHGKNVTVSFLFNCDRIRINVDGNFHANFNYVIDSALIAGIWLSGDFNLFQLKYYV